MGAPSHNPLPKSAFTPAVAYAFRIWALAGSTASEEMSRFQALSAGNIVIFNISDCFPVQAVFVIPEVESLPFTGSFPGSILFFEQALKVSRTTSVNIRIRFFIALDLDTDKNQIVYHL